MNDFLSFYSYPLYHIAHSGYNITGRKEIAARSEEREREIARSTHNSDITLLIISSISYPRKDRAERPASRGKITFGVGRNERTKASAASNVRNYSILPIKSEAGLSRPLYEWAQRGCRFYFGGESLIVTNVGNHVLLLHTNSSRGKPPDTVNTPNR